MNCRSRSRGFVPTSPGQRVGARIVSSSSSPRAALSRTASSCVLPAFATARRAGIVHHGRFRPACLSSRNAGAFTGSARGRGILLPSRLAMVGHAA